MTPVHHYLVIAARESPWWVITVPELDGIASQAVWWRDVEPMARDLIAVWLDIDIAEVTVTVQRSPIPAGPPGGPWLHVRVWADGAVRRVRRAFTRHRQTPAR